MAYSYYHDLTDEECVIVAKRFKHDLLSSGLTQQIVADKLGVAQCMIATWSNGGALIPHWRSMELQQQMRGTGLFLVKHLRPDFVRKFQPVIDTLCSHQNGTWLEAPFGTHTLQFGTVHQREARESATQFNVRRERERGNLK